MHNAYATQSIYASVQGNLLVININFSFPAMASAVHSIPMCIHVIYSIPPALPSLNNQNHHTHSHHSVALHCPQHYSDPHSAVHRRHVTCHCHCRSRFRSHCNPNYQISYADIAVEPDIAADSIVADYLVHEWAMVSDSELVGWAVVRDHQSPS